jgi:hypothetical protein
MPVRYGLSAERRLSHAIPVSASVTATASTCALPKRCAIGGSATPVRKLGIATGRNASPATSGPACLVPCRKRVQKKRKLKFAPMKRKRAR